MERNPHNFDDFSEDFDPRFSANENHSDDATDPAAGEPTEVGPDADRGPEWFDPRWLRANGASQTEDGDILQTGTPILVMVGAPADAASPGEEMDAALRVFGMLAWQRNRPARAGTLLEQMLRAESARRDWLQKNPFAVFWAATARTGPRRRRTSPRRI